MPADRAGSALAVIAGATLGGRFVLQSRLHTGATAEVWRAKDSQGSSVAVKLAGPAEGSRVRLRAEHATLARLTHSAIIRPIAWIDAGAHVALVTEYLPSGDLVSLAGAAPRHWASAIGEIAEALAYLHEHLLVHRDVKARNVLFDAAGHARLIDFGSAVETGSPRTLGGTTAAHRFAEVGTVAPTDDVFAFAVLVYELMAGRLSVGPEPGRPPRFAAPPLSVELHLGPALTALETLVLDSLHGNGAGSGSIQAFLDGIKLLVTEESERQ
jgi:serine/threonine protein kinase